MEAEQLGLVLIIDDSGSTDWNDPTDLRTEASVVALHQQGDGGIFALSTFSTTAVQVVGPSLLSGATRTSAEASIRSRIPAKLGTNYQDAFIEAKRQLDSMPASVDKKAVVFVSDGEAGSGYTSDLPIGAAGIPIYTVGFGLAPQDQMAAIAARSQGQTFPVADVAELQPIMAKILAVLECNAQNITEEVTLAPGATESIPFNVSPTEDEFKALASWDTGDVTTTITRPDGTTMSAATLLAGERWDSGTTFASGIGVDPQRGGWIFNLTASPANLASLDVTINVWGGKPVVEPTPDPSPVVDEPTDITPRSSEHPPPTGCTAIAMSRGANSEVTVSWDAADATSPDLGGYLVEYRHKGSKGAWTALPTTLDLEALVTGRVP
ncbi:MAG: hypothetical protein JWM25_512, partial [Thermoleophilia bacterium]|nr:hypothetical protein [Thermoleophilia bacterium]